MLPEWMMVHKTRFPQLGFSRVDAGDWRIVDQSDRSRMATVGPHYASREELLSDLDRYAKAFGLEVG